MKVSGGPDSASLSGRRERLDPFRERQKVHRPQEDRVKGNYIQTPPSSSSCAASCFFLLYLSEVVLRENNADQRRDPPWAGVCNMCVCVSPEAGTTQLLR